MPLDSPAPPGSGLRLLWDLPAALCLLRSLHLQVDVTGGGGAAAGRRVVGGACPTALPADVLGPQGHELLEVADSLQDAVQRREDVLTCQQLTHLMEESAPASLIRLQPTRQLHPRGDKRPQRRQFDQTLWTKMKLLVC